MEQVGTVYQGYDVLEDILVNIDGMNAIIEGSIEAKAWGGVRYERIIWRTLHLGGSDAVYLVHYLGIEASHVPYLRRHALQKLPKRLETLRYATLCNRTLEDR